MIFIKSFIQIHWNEGRTSVKRSKIIKGFFCLTLWGSVWGCDQSKEERVVEPETSKTKMLVEPAGQTAEVSRQGGGDLQQQGIEVEILNADSLNSFISNGLLTVRFQVQGAAVQSSYTLHCKSGKSAEIQYERFYRCSSNQSHLLSNLEEGASYLIVVKAVDRLTGENVGPESYAGFSYTNQGVADEAQEASDNKEIPLGIEGQGDQPINGGGVIVDEPGEPAPQPLPQGPVVQAVGGLDVIIPPHMYEQEFSTSHTMTGLLTFRQLEDDPFIWPFACMQRREHYRAYSFVDPMGVEHKRCEVGLTYTDYLSFTNYTMAKNHLIASTSPQAFQFPGRNERNEYIGYERVVVNVYEPWERPNPFDPALPGTKSDTLDMFEYMCSGNSSQFIPATLPGWMGIKRQATVRVCKTDVDASLSRYGAAEVWVAQFLAPDLPVGYTNFCASHRPCDEDVTTLEVLFIAQWDFAPTAGDFVQQAWDRVYDMLDSGGPRFPVAGGFRY